jgi:hypothetical protein
MKTAVELLMTGNAVRFPLTDANNYDSTKHNFGPVFFQGTDSWAGTTPFIGPLPIMVGRPMESIIAKPGGFPHMLKISSTKWAIVLADISTAATLRNFMLYIYDLSANTLTYSGAISFTWPTAATVRAIRLQRSTTSTGTVAVSGTAVTGTGTDWFTKRINAGARIGFGSTNPDNITTWYDIAPATAITSDSSLTLASSAGTIASGTPYIIEDYSLIVATTNATTTDGGIRVIKGLSLSSACWSLTATATAIALASATDNLRAVYWLKDASTVTNIVAAGFALDAVSADNLTQNLYVLDGSSTTAKIYVYNVKKALTLSSGVDLTAYQFVTGAPTVTGNVSQNFNCRIATLNHGAGSGVNCLYFTTTTRLYRCPLTSITSGSTTFLADSMVEVPPGSTNTIPATNSMSSLEFFDSLDRLGWISNSATAFKSYVTQYRTDSSQLDHIWLGDSKVQHQSSSDATAYPYPSTDSTLMTTYADGGLCVLARHGTTAALNQIYLIPIAAHWGYQNKAPYNVYITPAIQTPGASKFWRLCVNEAQNIGGDTLGISPEGYKVYYRTSGITDNSGAWTLLPANFDMSGITAATSIQFKFEFKILSLTCVPARIFGLYLIYEVQDDIPSSLRWNMDDSSATDGTTGFIQSTSFSVFPNVMQIDYYRSDTNADVLTQSSSSTTNGVFEYWNGSAWTAGLGTNTIGLRRRFRPTAGLPNGVAVYPKLTVVS